MLAGAHRLGTACETAAWPYGDRHIGPKPFIRQRCLLGQADYAHARRGETFDSAGDTAIVVVTHPPPAATCRRRFGGASSCYLAIANIGMYEGEPSGVCTGPTETRPCVASMAAP